MTDRLRFLIAESESPEDRAARERAVGRSNGETYRATLLALQPGAHIDLVQPAEADCGPLDLGGYDAVFLSGSPIHLYTPTPAVHRHVAFMRAVFASGTPSFGSCAGLQVAVVAAGGSVRPNRQGQEAGFARRIVRTVAGRDHPLLAGRPETFDAPCLHADEVDALPEGGILLATNGVTRVQSVEIRCGPGVFWGVQYHPELPLDEIATALRRQSGTLVSEGLAQDAAAVEQHAARIEALHNDPARRDLAWQLGLDSQVTDPALRQTELRNFIRHLVLPTRAARRRTALSPAVPMSVPDLVPVPAA